jgi:hypothetical protein
MGLQARDTDRTNDGRMECAAGKVHSVSLAEQDAPDLVRQLERHTATARHDHLVVVVAVRGIDNARAVRPLARDEALGLKPRPGALAGLYRHPIRRPARR